MSFKPSGNKFTWEDDDEEEDSKFLNNRTPYNRTNNTIAPQGSSYNYEMKREQLLEEKRKLQEQTLMGTNSSLGILYETEQVGLQTAEDLVRQREQLENVDEKLDEINSTMKISQRHISSMKSFFGGVRNYFKKAPVEPTPLPPTTKTSFGAPSLQEAISQREDTTASGITHPVLRNMTPSPALSPDDAFENKMTNNLDQMCSGLGRLKNLAIGLSDEIDDQNDLLEKINTKASRADETIGHQNMQIRRILKK